LIWWWLNLACVDVESGERIACMKQILCRCGHGAEQHTRSISGTDDNGCTGEKLFDDTGKKVFDDEKGAIVQTQKSCRCQEFVPRSDK
jgi:hypothetical protein